jgi:hypothetical protein
MRHRVQLFTLVMKCHPLDICLIHSNPKSFIDFHGNLIRFFNKFTTVPVHFRNLRIELDSCDVSSNALSMLSLKPLIRLFSVLYNIGDATIPMRVLIVAAHHDMKIFIIRFIISLTRNRT